jgi:thiamine biosynthesis lipoprotein
MTTAAARPTPSRRAASPDTASPDTAAPDTAAPDTATWRALGVEVRLVVTEAAALGEARAVVVQRLDELDLACSRFRPDAEIVRLDDAAGRPRRISPLLTAALEVALDAARRTDGALDPTLGKRLAALGYDRTFAAVEADGPALPAAVSVRVLAPASWRDVVLDAGARTVTVPAGVRLDLGATAKAWAADRIAREVAERFGTGAVVCLGGDLAVAGEAGKGWPIAVQETDSGAAAQVVLIAAGGLATSGTAARRWMRGSDRLHHIIDPRTGLPARTPWRAVTVAASSCREANIASTTTVVLGEAGLDWLGRRGLPARLVAEDGRVTVVGGWPD